MSYARVGYGVFNGLGLDVPILDKWGRQITGHPTTASYCGAAGAPANGPKSVQQMLKDLGFYKGDVDGSFGTGTWTAMRAFEASTGTPNGGQYPKGGWCQALMDTWNARFGAGAGAQPPLPGQPQPGMPPPPPPGMTPPVVGPPPVVDYPPPPGPPGPGQAAPPPARTAPPAAKPAPSGNPVLTWWNQQTQPVKIGVAVGGTVIVGGILYLLFAGGPPPRRAAALPAYVPPPAPPPSMPVVQQAKAVEHHEAPVAHPNKKRKKQFLMAGTISRTKGPKFWGSFGATLKNNRGKKRRRRRARANARRGSTKYRPNRALTTARVDVERTGPARPRGRAPQRITAAGKAYVARMVKRVPGLAAYMKKRCRFTPPKKYRKYGATERSHYLIPECYGYPVHGNTVERTKRFIRTAASRLGKHKHRLPPFIRRRAESKLDAAKRRYHIGQYHTR